MAFYYFSIMTVITGIYAIFVAIDTILSFLTIVRKHSALPLRLPSG
jgi:hypothetical protein